MGRKKARDNAFKCVYQLEFMNGIERKDILNACFEENGNEEEEKQYIEEVLIKTQENLEQIDAMILSKLKNWTMQRIAKIDLAILRLAICEIYFMDGIPYKVSANEAVELAKTYGNNDSKSFVNGVLAKIIESKDEHSGNKSI